MPNCIIGNVPSNFQKLKYKALRKALRHEHIKHGGTEQAWQTINNNPALFNRAWRKLLKLPINDTPPPEQYR